MLITTVCPRCQTTYQVQESLRGKPMRCPQERCRHIFLVGDRAQTTPPAPAAPPPEPATPSGQQSGAVGDLVPLFAVEIDPVPQPEPSAGPDLVPLLPVEPVEVEPVLEAIEPGGSAPAWLVPPPVRRGPGAKSEREEPSTPIPAAERKRRPEPAPAEKEEKGGPRVVEAGSWEAPPVRRGQEQPPGPVAPEVVPTSQDTPAAHDERPVVEVLDRPHAPPGRFVRFFIVAITVLSIVGLGAGGVIVWRLWQLEEKRLAEAAAEFYNNGLHPRAVETYDKLIKGYPNSDELPRYQFQRELADIRARIAEKPDDPDELVVHIEQFVKDHKQTLILPLYGTDISQALIKLLADYSERVVKAPAEGEPLQHLERAEPVVKLVKTIKLPRDTDKPPPDWKKLDEAFASARSAVALFQRRQKVLARLDEMAGSPSYQSIQRARALVREQEGTFPGLGETAEVRRRMQQMLEGHQKSVQYVAKPDGIKQREAGDREEPAILYDARRGGDPADPPDSDGIVLALSRGVLYALNQSDGKVRWAMRVGIDTTALPVRVPARVGSQERILVLSSDPLPVLTALDTEGNQLWRYPLGTPSLGRPIVVDQRAYLATYDGKVHEIELVEGKLLGQYHLNQRLTLGGVREGDTRRLYFPADDGCIYVLDVDQRQRRCEMILYSGHPAGSLRGEPVIIPPEGEDPSGLLILNQASGLRAVELRAFDLPLRGPNAPARKLSPAPRLEGWTWFQPYHDPEKVVMLTDTGVLGLFGIRQPSNQDQVLFPLLPGGGLRLPGPTTAGERGRAEVVQVQGDDLWALAGGRLQRLKLAWGQDVGPRVISVWKGPPEVGSPLHASQVVVDQRGRTFLVSVTQPARQLTCWASCIDDEQGRLRWRRQLGLVCQTEPLALPAKDGPLLLAVDQSAALFGLDPARYQVPMGGGWLSASRGAFLKGSLEDNPEQPPVVLPGADGHSAWVIAFAGASREMVLRHVRPHESERRLLVSEGRIPMLHPLAGQSALVDGRLVLPLADGTLARVPAQLPLQSPEPDLGPNWRAQRASPEARCWLVSLGGDRFLSTDGARGLSTWQWPAGGTCTGLPKNRDVEPTLEMKDRVVAAPVRLTGKPGEPVRVCVADNANVLSLIEVQPDGKLDWMKRTWKLDGAVTTGPWLLSTPEGERVACIVERTRLVWIDPARPDARLEWAGKDAIVGQPRIADGLLVVADQAGRYVALDPATGKPQGEGYELRGSVAPVCSPVAFHKGYLLAPLSDGTTMLLAIDRLKK